MLAENLRAADVVQRLFSSVRVLAASVAIFGVAFGAVAQGPGGGGGGGGRGGFGGGGFGGGGFGGDVMQPSVNSREVERLTKIASLDKDQQEAVKTLYEAYQDDFRNKSQALRTKMERARDEFRDSRDRTAFDSIRADFEKFRPVRDELEKGFLADVKTVLRDDQQQAWPKFERALRRARGLNRGRLSGERVDLLAIVDRAELPEESKAQVTPLLDQYEEELDRALTARMTFEQDQMSKGIDAFQNGDMQTMQKMLEEGRKLALAVREVNRKYARQIEELVPDDKKPVIAEEVKRQSFGRIYNETRAERLVKAAKGMSDLTDEQKVSVEALASSFTRDMTSLNDQLAKGQEKMEMTVTAENMMNMFRGGGDGGPLDDLYSKRRQLGSKTEDDLRKILTPEQQAKLPSAEDDQGGRRRGGQDNVPRPQRAAPRRTGNGSA